MHARAGLPLLPPAAGPFGRASRHGLPSARPERRRGGRRDRLKTPCRFAARVRAKGKGPGASYSIAQTTAPRGFILLLRMTARASMRNRVVREADLFWSSLVG